MLGYGDCVVPGLLIAMLRRFDVAVDRTLASGYMLAGLMAYSVGLLLTDLALAYSVFGSKGQPGAQLGAVTRWLTARHIPDACICHLPMPSYAAPSRERGTPQCLSSLRDTQ